MSHPAAALAVRWRPLTEAEEAALAEEWDAMVEADSFFADDRTVEVVAILTASPPC